MISIKFWYIYINMQKDISTNIRIPENLWRSIKVKAAQEGKSMKDLILEGISIVLKEEKLSLKKEPPKDLLLEFSGRIDVDVPDGSIRHDHYLYEK